MATAFNLFDRFGGIRPMAEALREPPSTVQSWKSSGRVPSTKQPTVLARAAELGLDVTANDVVFPLATRPAVGDELDQGDTSAHFDRCAALKQIDA